MNIPKSVINLFKFQIKKEFLFNEGFEANYIEFKQDLIDIKSGDKLVNVGVFWEISAIPKGSNINLVISYPYSSFINYNKNIYVLKLGLEDYKPYFNWKLPNWMEK